ncbi:glycine zipper 2TM domain-containing protein [Rhodanobacter sp. L36]|uniref:glycine zipper 2TM domain-containing protein n=1 Tax=Rhodanobacter sp. L36 TaxID=1747221 RepID=UPI00131ABB1E|nr:glycine zipper 2TM domain-containing protein [Rhodanobacter sp. L36]
MTHRTICNAAFAVLLLASGTSAIHAQNYHHVRQVCHDVRVQDRPRDNHRIAGTAIGAVAGGLLGHQVGGGKGKTLATVGGAVAGGYVGNRVQKNNQDNHAGYHIERRCHDVHR